MISLQPTLDAEWIVAHRARSGGIADFAGKAPDARTISAAFLRTLMVSRRSGDGAPVAIAIHGAIIEGDVDLRGLGSSALSMPALELHNCAIRGVLRLASSYWDAIVLDGCSFDGLEARGLHVQRGLSARAAFSTAPQPIVMDLRDVCAGAHVDFGEFGRLLGAAAPSAASLWLDSARIAGNLTCAGAHLANAPEFALRARGASIDGDLRLSISNGHRFEAFGLVDLLGLRVGGRIDAEGARIGSASDRRALTLSYANIAGAVQLRASSTTPFTAIGAVRLFGVRIGGGLECAGAHFEATTEHALDIESAHIAGAVLLRVKDGHRFTAQGAVRLYNANIQGNLDCSGGEFTMRGDQQNALDAESAVIDGLLLLRALGDHPFVAEGTVRLYAATIGGEISLNGATLRRPGGICLNADRVSVDGSVFFLRSGNHSGTAIGEVSLFGAIIEGAVRFDGANIQGSDGLAVDLEYASIANGALFRSTKEDRFQARGCLRLFRAKVGGSVECDGALLENPDGTALLVEGATIGGALLIRSSPHGRFEATGTIRLFAASIGSSLDCQGASLSRPGDICLQAEGAEIRNSVLLRPWNPEPSIDRPVDGFASRGTIRLRSARIGGSLELRDPTLQPGPGNELVNLHNTSIGEILFVELNDRCAPGIIRLSGCHANELRDQDGAGWGPRGIALELDRFTYDKIATSTQVTPSTFGHRVKRTLRHAFVPARPSSLCGRRIDWLSRQHPADARSPAIFSPQPYEHLAKILRLIGHADDARHIMLQKHARERQYGEDGVVVWALKSLFHHLFGFGYLPARAFLTFVGWWLFGWLMLSIAMDCGAFVKATTSVEIARVMSQPNTVPQSPGLYFKGDRLEKKRGKEEPEARYQRFPEVQVREIPCTDASPVLYALDTMLPLLALHQAEKCEMADDERWWRWGRAFYAAIGWIITALTALTWTGILRRVPE